MRLSVLAIVLAAVLFTGSAMYGQDRGLGVGIRIGEPSGLTAKYWISGTNALDFGLGYSLIREHRQAHITADYLYHNESLIKAEDRIPVFYGFGLRLITKEENSTSLGVRGVAGLAWYSKDMPLDAFVEVAPVFRLFPSTSVDMDISLGARYFFDVTIGQ